MKQLPIKFRTLQLVSQNEGISNEEIAATLKKEYPLDKFVSYKGVEEYLLALKAVGLIEPINVTLAASGELKQSYKITDYGTTKMKYVNQ